MTGASGRSGEPNNRHAKIAIIDYGVGNLGSIRNMFRKIGASASITSDPKEIQAAERLVLPGVGAFDVARQNLDRSGLIPILESEVITRSKPLLAICLGMQLVTNGSEEGSQPGLGWVDATSVRFRPIADAYKVPHMGWAMVESSSTSRMFAHMETPRFYFLHSYFVRCDSPHVTTATAVYGGEVFVAAIESGSIWAVQFHPEKSHRFGMQLFRNFVAL